jgi:hypothetical protein
MEPSKSVEILFADIRCRWASGRTKVDSNQALNPHAG